VTGATETYAPKGSKQVEIVGKDGKRGFTVVVGISMNGDVLPFQAIYVGSTFRSLSTSDTPEYQKATQVLKFCFEFEYGSLMQNQWWQEKTALCSKNRQDKAR
jgi:hypothetical protein